jgi:hypothetical protein
MCLGPVANHRFRGLERAGDRVAAAAQQIADQEDQDV